ncbi:MAG: cysteine desulfurase family protein [Alphaproteobacteria bacterium]
MEGDRIYLDYNATSPVRPVVIDALRDALLQGGNPSSVHSIGRRARGLVERSRARIGARLNAAPETLIFASGGTEANGLALAGPVRAGLVDRLIIGATEHDAVRAPASRLDVPMHSLRVGPDGLADLDHLDQLLKACAAQGHRPLVSVMHANNETGVLSPLQEIVQRVKTHTDGLVHTDAVQTVGRIPVDVDALGVDLLTLSGHKLGGAPGVGVLYARPGLALSPVIDGGGQELGRRSGTENVPAIAGLAAALDAAASDDHPLADWRDRFEAGLKAAAPEAVIFGARAPRLANTTCFAVPGLTGETQVMALDLAGVSVSSGAACSSGKVARSAVLAAMGQADDLSNSAIRLSLGWASREDDLSRCLAAWTDHYQRWRARRTVGDGAPAGGDRRPVQAVS